MRWLLVYPAFETPPDRPSGNPQSAVSKYSCSGLRTRALHFFLDIAIPTCIIRVVRTYSTSQAAKKVKVGRDTLNRWIRDRKFDLPPLQKVGGVSVRLWDEADLEKVRTYKKDNYRKGGGRPSSKK